MERTRVTAAGFAALPETSQPTELIDGELIVSPAPPDEHQVASGHIYLLLAQLVGGRGALRYAPSDVYLDDANVVQPDLFWVSPENTRCVLGPDRHWHGPPDLVIEILSPSTQRHDRGVKFDLYERHGVREYWLVDIDAQFVEVFRREGERLMRQGVYAPGQSFTSAVLGDRSVDVSRLLGVESVA